MNRHSVRRGAGLLLMIASLAGCASFEGLHPQARVLEAQDLQAAASLREHSLSEAAWPAAQWWTALGDPRLDQLIEEALHDSPDLQVASAREHQALAAADVADAARRPTSTASASISRSRLARDQDPMGQGDRYGTLRSLGLNFSYTFDLWGGQRANWEAAVSQARAAQIDRQAARLNVATDVARAYSQLAQAHVVRDLADEDLQRTRRMLELGRQRLKSGIDSQYQYEQSESLEAGARQALLDADKRLRSARIALAVLLGKGPDRGASLPRPNVLTPAAVALPSSLPAVLLGRRPDVVAARWRVEAAGKAIEAGKARFYPNLNLTAALGTESLLGDALLGDASRFFNIAPALSLPLFEGGRLRAALDARDADYELAVAQYNKTLVAALGQVSDTISQLRDIDGQIQARQQATDIIAHSFDTATLRYGAGIGNYLDVLSIEQQLLQSQRQLADLNAERIDLSIRLMQALGGGLQAEAPARASTASLTTR